MMVPRLTIYKQKEIFLSIFCIIMSFPIPSDISQNDANMLEQQYLEMQKRYKEEQWSQV